MKSVNWLEMKNLKGKKLITKETPVARIYKDREGILFLELQDAEPIKTGFGAIETYMRDGIVLEELEV